ncbi:nucleoside deaminase [Dermacoccus profundi]
MDLPAAPAVETTYATWMADALARAREAAAAGDVPVGALVVDEGGAVIGVGANLREADGDPTGHAEIVAMRRAATSRGSWRLDGCTLVVTLEPCLMCAGAAVQARLPRIVLGAWDRKAGACGGLWDVVRDSRSTHRIEVVGGIREAECAEVLTDFFHRRRA